jgi:hypothetical protein
MSSSWDFPSWAKPSWKVAQSSTKRYLFFGFMNFWTKKNQLVWEEKSAKSIENAVQNIYMYTVFPHIRPAGIIFLQGLQLRVLLECGYYSRAGIIF